jgi:hypothetical protein
MVKCNGNIKNGKECCFTGKHEYNGEYYCTKHLKVTKANDECSICYVNMDDSKDRIELSCGHFFHIRCLSMCKANCPLCRKKFLPTESYKIFKSTVVKPISFAIFGLPLEQHPSFFTSLRYFIGVAQKGSWYIEVMLRFTTTFYNYTKDLNIFAEAFERFLCDIQNC